MPAGAAPILDGAAAIGAVLMPVMRSLWQPARNKLVSASVDRLVEIIRILPIPQLFERFATLQTKI